MARIVNGVIVHDNQSGSNDDGSQSNLCSGQMEPWMKYVLLGLVFFLFGLKGLLFCGVGYGAYYLMSNQVCDLLLTGC